MPAQKESLKERLERYREIHITVTGRKSGRAITVPVWFVSEDGTLYLLPVKGSDTQWFKNVRHDPKMKIEARGAKEEIRVKPVEDAEKVKAIVEKFRSKYGAADVKKYYSKFDVAVTAPLG